MIEATPAPDLGALVGVDVGGTFTDAVVVAGGRRVTAKVPTTPDDQSEGVVAAVRLALARAGVDATAVTRFAHGMTVGTNALLEGTGARTGLVATEGFGDLLELRRQNRAHLYRLDAHHPPPLVPPARVAEVRERCGPEGVVTPLDEGSLARAVARLGAEGVEAVAVGLLFAFAHPAHERRVVAALRAALPGVHVSASAEVLPEIREYERISTTAVDAYLTPVLGSYLRRLGARAAAAGLPEPVIMQSSGGVLALAEAAAHAAWTVLSGPAGGVIGAAHGAGGGARGAGGGARGAGGGARGAGGAEGVPELALTFDMGGTSCDVALVRDGVPARAAGTEIGGHPVHLPMLDVVTVSAGGGSVAWADSGGALRVGPRSAGARPGPAAYGRGGTEPTVTDANLVLGRLDPDAALGGAVRLDPAAAAAAVAGLGARLGLDVTACAEGILRVAGEEMVRALRRVSVERGVDPRAATLIAFGGAGPLHACHVAEALGARRVRAPAAAGMLAALGLVLAGERRDYVQTVLAPVGDGRLANLLAPLRAQAARELPGAEQSAAADCRSAGQSHALTVAWDPDAGESALRAAFFAAHRERYGDVDAERAVQAVSLRLAAERPGPRPKLAAGAPGPWRAGPARVALDGATAWVAPGWRARAEGDGALWMEWVDAP